MRDKYVARGDAWVLGIRFDPSVRNKSIGDLVVCGPGNFEDAALHILEKIFGMGSGAAVVDKCPAPSTQPGAKEQRMRWRVEKVDIGVWTLGLEALRESGVELKKVRKFGRLCY